MPAESGEWPPREDLSSPGISGKAPRGSDKRGVDGSEEVGDAMTLAREVPSPRRRPSGESLGGERRALRAERTRRKGKAERAKGEASA